DHRRAALHRRIGKRRVAVVVVKVGVEVHRQHLLRVHEVVLLDAVEERLHAFRALLAGLGLKPGGQELDHVVDQPDAHQRDQREHDRDARDVQALGDLLGHVGAGDEQDHRDEQAELQVEEQAHDDGDAEDRDQRGMADAERVLDVLARQIGGHRGDRDEPHQDQLADAQLRQKIDLFLPLGHLAPLFLTSILRVWPWAFKLKLPRMSKAFVKEDSAEPEVAQQRAAAAPDGKNYITPEGYARLKAELKSLVEAERPEVVRTVAWAASNGDRSENGD